jgi:hypothetical protein
MKKAIVIACIAVLGMAKTQAQESFRAGISVLDYGVGNHNDVLFSLGETNTFNIN